MANSIYTVKCAVVAGGAQFFSFEQGMMIEGADFIRNEMLVHIPLTDGDKDVSDGKLLSSHVLVTGKMDRTGSTAAGLLLANLGLMRNTLMNADDDFYVWPEWTDGMPSLAYHVHHVQSVKWAFVYGYANTQAEVEVVFTMTDPEMVVAT